MIGKRQSQRQSICRLHALAGGPECKVRRSPLQGGNLSSGGGRRGNSEYGLVIVILRREIFRDLTAAAATENQNQAFFGRMLVTNRIHEAFTGILTVSRIEVDML